MSLSGQRQTNRKRPADETAERVFEKRVITSPRDPYIKITTKEKIILFSSNMFSHGTNGTQLTEEEEEKEKMKRDGE
jgi:hypothetical protein